MITLTFKEEGALPYDQQKNNSFFMHAVEHGWHIGAIVPVGKPSKMFLIEYMSPPQLNDAGREVEEGQITLRSATRH